MPARILMIALVTAVAAFGEFVGTAFAASGPVATFPSAKQPSKAVLFNGTSSMVTVRHTADLKLTHAMTLEARVMPSSRLSGRRDIIVKTRSRGPFPYGLELTNGVPDAYATIDGQVLTVSASSALALHKWSFVAAYYNGQSFQLYVNHRLVASRSARGDLSTAKGPVEIGGDSRWGRHYHGTIDEVRIYSRSLSSTHGKDRRAQPPGTATPTTTKPARVTPATAAPTSSSPPPADPDDSDDDAPAPDDHSPGVVGVGEFVGEFVGWVVCAAEHEGCGGRVGGLRVDPGRVRQGVVRGHDQYRFR